MSWLFLLLFLRVVCFVSFTAMPGLCCFLERELREPRVTPNPLRTRHQTHAGTQPWARLLALCATTREQHGIRRMASRGLV